MSRRVGKHQFIVGEKWDFAKLDNSLVVEP